MARVPLECDRNARMRPGPFECFGSNLRIAVAGHGTASHGSCPALPRGTPPHLPSLSLLPFSLSLSLSLSPSGCPPSRPHAPSLSPAPPRHTLLSSACRLAAALSLTRRMGPRPAPSLGKRPCQNSRPCIPACLPAPCLSVHLSACLPACLPACVGARVGRPPPASGCSRRRQAARRRRRAAVAGGCRRRRAAVDYVGRICTASGGVQTESGGCRRRRAAVDGAQPL